ncbi:class F sortase [Streptomyces sp. NPDC018610]|uniref:class F sortase n=1 Tax=Streptomyces sp. NPDC018610 TaxID=3365049 RepID=UPI0037B0F16B
MPESAEGDRDPARGDALLLWPAATALVAGLATAVYGVASMPDPPPQPAAAAASPTAVPSEAASPVPVLGFSPPVAIAVPRLGIRADVIRLGLDEDGSVAVPRPEQARLAGWYEHSPAPGQRGATVVLGHVDSARLPGGKAVFYRLGSLRPGDRVDIRRADGVTASFAVDRVTTVSKDRFPTEAVYGPATTPQLRLITCGGAYTAGRGYTGNVIVFGHYTGARSG